MPSGVYYPGWHGVNSKEVPIGLEAWRTAGGFDAETLIYGNWAPVATEASTSNPNYRYNHILCHYAYRGVPFEGTIMGPMDEEPKYSGECRELAQGLGIDADVRFTGRVNVKEYYGKVDVIVLTSISEAQPFAILEANCAGLPVVATDVGACRELVRGRTPDDQALGESGFLTPVASPELIADALQRYAKSPDLTRRMGQIGRQRALRFYDINDVMSEYLNLYETYLYAGHLPHGDSRQTAAGDVN